MTAAGEQDAQPQQASDEAASADELIAFPQTSTRDAAATRAALERWLATHLPDGAAPRIVSFEPPSGNGMSSETVLFDVAWNDRGEEQTWQLVARMAPDPDNVPVFPEYDLERQAVTMRTVSALSDVPVPKVHWTEADASVLGAPFFVMERIDGIVPPDILPYNMMSWLLDASPDDRRRLQESTVTALAKLHSIEGVEEMFHFLPGATPDRTPLQRHVDEQRAYYEWVVADGQRSPLIEAAFAWLDEHWPEEEGPTVLSWGDSRIGNVLYRDFEPVAILDWEMAALGPPELDVAWLITMHAFFENVAEHYEQPGMPDFLRRDDVVEQYSAITGYTPRDLDFYGVYASMRHAIIMSRIGRRSIHFGEMEAPADIDELITHRTMLEAMLAGTFRWQ